MLGQSEAAAELIDMLATPTPEYYELVEKFHREKNARKRNDRRWRLAFKILFISYVLLFIALF